jgi:hypothetical protein
MGLKISELVSALNKVQSAIGEAEVVFKAAGDDAETVLTSIELQLGADGTPTGSGVQLVHETAKPEPATDATSEPAAPDAGPQTAADAPPITA